MYKKIASGTFVGKASIWGGTGATPPLSQCSYTCLVLQCICIIKVSVRLIDHLYSINCPAPVFPLTDELLSQLTPPRVPDRVLGQRATPWAGQTY